MNLMGMGIMELAVVFLVAFLVLGPSKSIDMARTVGKVVRDLRRTMADLSSAVDLDLDRPASSGGDRPAPVAVPEENPPGKSEDE